MSESPSTSNTATPKMSVPGTPPSPYPDATSNLPVGLFGDPSILGCTFTEEDLQEAIDTNDECELEFLMSVADRHPIAIICARHGWRGDMR